MFLWITATTRKNHTDVLGGMRNSRNVRSHLDTIHTPSDAQHQGVVWDGFAMWIVPELLLHNATGSEYIWIKQLLIRKIWKL